MASIAETEPCLTCKRPIRGVPICLDSTDSGESIANRQKLKILVPELDLLKNKVYMLCMSCNYKLLTSYTFRMMCLSVASNMKVDPTVVAKVEPEDIDDTSTKVSNEQNLNPPVSVEPADTSDVQKRNVLVVVKSTSPATVDKLETNKIIKNPCSPVTNQTITLSAFLKQSQNGNMQKVVSKSKTELGNQTTNEHTEKPSSSVASKPLTVATFLKQSQNVNVQKVLSKSKAALGNQTTNAHTEKPSSSVASKQLTVATFLKQSQNVNVQKVLSKSKAALGNETTNAYSEKPSSSVASKPLTVATFLKQSQNGNKVLQVVGKPLQTKIILDKANLNGRRVTYLKKSKPLVPIRPKLVTTDALILNNKDTPVVAKPTPIEVDDKVIIDMQEKLSSKLDTKIAVTPTSKVYKQIVNSDKQKSVLKKLDSPVPVTAGTTVIIDKIGQKLEVNIVDAPVVTTEPAATNDTKMDCSNIAESAAKPAKSTVKKNAQKSPGNIKIVPACDTSDLDDQRSARKLIMNTLYKAVMETKESGLTPAKRQLRFTPWEPEKNLSETIVSNWNKNISSLVRNELFNNGTSAEKEEGSAEVNQSSEISEPPPEVNEPPDVNKRPDVNKPTEVNQTPEVNSAVKENESVEVKTEIKTEPDDVEFISETFLEPSTIKSTVKKSHEEEQQERSQIIDLPMKSKTTFLCKCNHCGLLLTSKETLVKHIRQHFKNNPVQCDQCKTQFGDISSYNAHMCIYETEKKAVVSEFEPECPKPKECKCNRYFGNIRTLNIHLETTCENSTFCMTCNMGFVDVTSTNCHLRNVHNLFLCNLCRKMFRDKKYLMTHLHVMHEKKVPNKKIKYRCPFKSCKKTFKFYETYELHLTYKHQEYYSNIYWEDCKTSYVTYMCNLCKNNDKQICLNLLDQNAFIVQLQKNHAL
ncbi:PREDICTED: uncharacterized protein LOC108562329 [Nicrophorus vespilloides]|uniref:Uncharacterized protein LOC108562329 n=1 Tax=Nicrophorus vespilloides TaxID=110193 RepID=A0ABM1MNF9_NICVS|nr:PREDICTED: uncharacterized protein LOC108562329 [Nicrophorus vespilloides]